MESQVLQFKNISLPITWEIQHSPFKRCFDIGFSALLIVFIAPFFLGLVIAIRLSSKGKAIYVQPRLGRGGRVFKCYKLRTMHLDADERLGEILKKSPRLEREWIKKQKLKNDPRISPLGKWLRRTSLDELPQFWNVIKGDLSVVGPRPYMISQKNDLGSLAPQILSVRPGLTGLWQTSGRSQTTFQERIALDAEYVKKRSFWYDLRLILKTLPQLLFSNDAY